MNWGGRTVATGGSGAVEEGGWGVGGPRGASGRREGYRLRRGCGKDPRFGWGGPRAFALLGALAWSWVGAAQEGRAQDRPFPLDTLRVAVGSRVDGRMPALTRSVRVLDRAELERLPVRTLAEALAWAVGVDIQARSPAQADLSLRGSSFEQVVVLVNGVRVSDPQTGHHDLNLTVPLDRIERVEILRGAASALYGADAVGGVVNVVTRQAEAGWHGRVEGGSWGTVRGSVGAGWGDPHGRFVGGGAEWSRSDGHRPGTDYEMVLLHGKGGGQVGRGSLRGEVGLARRDFGAQDFYARYPSFERTRTYTAALRWFGGGGTEGVRSPSGDGRAFLLELGTSVRRHEDEFILVRTQPSLYRNRHTSHVLGGDLLARFRGPMGWRMALGGEAFGDLLESNRLGNRQELRGGLYAEMVRGGGGTPWVVTLGARQDWHEGFGGAFSPALSASYTFAAGVRLRGAAGRSFRVPTFTERYYRDPANVGREDLGTERAWSGEVGADLSPSGTLALSVTAFTRKAEGLIDWARPVGAPPTTPWETRNVKEATFLGLEGEARWEGPAGLQWTVGGSALSFQADDLPGFVSKYVLRPLTEQWTVGVRRQVGGQTLVGLHLQQGRRKGEEPHRRLDFQTRFRLASWVIHLDGTNLADERHPDVTGAPSPGRGFFLAVERLVGR